MGVFPTRSPIPIAQAWTREAPARIAASVLTTASPRSQWPCQSSSTSAALSRTTSSAKRTRLAAPVGVAWPTVSHRHRRRAPHAIAVRKSRRSVSGRARTVSSVTYITGSPCETA